MFIIKKLLTNFENKVSFQFDELLKECEITIYDSEKRVLKKTFSYEEGKEKLLEYCLLWKHFDLNAHFDTIGLKNKEEYRGFVRYKKEDGIIDENMDITTLFLCHILESYERQKEVEISRVYDYNDYKTYILCIKGDDLLTLNINPRKYIKRVLEKYRKEHTEADIFLCEDEKRIRLNNLYFDLDLFPVEEQADFLNSSKKEECFSLARKKDEKE